MSWRPLSGDQCQGTSVIGICIKTLTAWTVRAKRSVIAQNQICNIAETAHADDRFGEGNPRDAFAADQAKHAINPDIVQHAKVA